jgi:hypothetical protein
MLVSNAENKKPCVRDERVLGAMDSIDETDLRNWVKSFSVPRHYTAQPKINCEIANTIADLFMQWGYAVTRQGKYYNIVATPPGVSGPFQLVVAHFDSTAFTPGADDNASALAAMLGCAKVLSQLKPTRPVMFVAFNCEEDGLLGSFDYVQQLGASQRKQILCAHVLEMVDYATDAPDSQKTPAGLPIRIPTTGNFLGLLANSGSATEMSRSLQQARSYVPELPTFGLRVLLGFEKYLPVLLRSDHAPFWQSGIPSVMWTDTSEFRNPHYHRDTDLPETLNYTFLRRVTQLLVATVSTARSK